MLPSTPTVETLSKLSKSFRCKLFWDSSKLPPNLQVQFYAAGLFCCEFAVMFLGLKDFAGLWHEDESYWVFKKSSFLLIVQENVLAPGEWVYHRDRSYSCPVCGDRELKPHANNMHLKRLTVLLDTTRSDSRFRQFIRFVIGSMRSRQQPEYSGAFSDWASWDLSVLFVLFYHSFDMYTAATAKPPLAAFICCSLTLKHCHAELE